MDTTEPKNERSAEIATTALLGLLLNYATEADVEAEKTHFDESTPLEIVIISAVLKGMQEYAEETAHDEMYDGFSGEESSERARLYYESRELLQGYWSRRP